MRNPAIARWLAAGLLLALFGCNHSGSSSDATTSGSNSADNAASAPAQTPPVVIGAGTGLTVTMDESIGTQSNSSGDRFAASLAEPVTIDGRELLPRGRRFQ